MLRLVRSSLRLATSGRKLAPAHPRWLSAQPLNEGSSDDDDNLDFDADRVVADGPPTPLTEKSREHLLKPLLTVGGWKMAESGRDALEKRFEFGNFRDAFLFMSQVAIVADDMNHHPEWFNVYNRVDVTLSTHDVGGLSLNDIELAEAVDVFANSVLTKDEGKRE